MPAKNNQSWRHKIEAAIQQNLLLFLFGFLSIGVIVAGVVLWSYFAQFSGKLSDEQGVWGQFGDFVGGTLNPIFALLSFIALLMTLLIQNKELVISSEELKKSTEALSQQSKALDLQNFERTFFELIRLHHELVNGIVIRESSFNYSDESLQERSTKREGRECFAKFYSNLSNYYHKILEGIDQTQSMPARIEEAFEQLIDYEQSSIGHYFRNLYHIFKFIDEGDVVNKQRYASIVRAQLSSNELCLLFYNALMPQNIKFKVLIEKYAVLENMSFDKLFDKEQHLSLYESAAYGDK